ncbi:response regulator transcription factor [[Clostridium] innocuum]|nr:response regulator transcription factor [[Clostridium] innocuum]MCC2797223.1 response regulator transcription factor [[Clostridium] innocuum]MCC2829346.1 response regulator transcription factor [[Clostridium] innocuum]
MQRTADAATETGYEAICWNMQEDIRELVKTHDPHIILLDINLPQMDGFTVCSQLRSFSKVPIIFVTSRNTDMDELCSMQMGGDDFITKPYNTSILLARIAALLKRSYEWKDQNLTHHGVLLDVAMSRVEFQNNTRELTKNEVKILHYMFQHKGEIIPREDLIDYLWDNKLFIDDNALSVNVTRIRNKLRELGVEDFIVTRHRQGYQI